MSVSRMVDIARGQIGVTSGATFNRWIGLADNSPWCATFVSWCANQAGILTTAATAAPPRVLRNAAVRQHRTFYNNSRRSLALRNDPASSNFPRRGDVIIWHPNRASHMGIVVSATRDAITIVHGNWGGRVQETVHRNWATSGEFEFIGSNHVSW